MSSGLVRFPPPEFAGANFGTQRSGVQRAWSQTLSPRLGATRCPPEPGAIARSSRVESVSNLAAITDWGAIATGECANEVHDPKE